MARVPITTEIGGSVWKILKKVGDKVAEDETVMIIESMKMEIPLSAPESGTVVEVLVSEGDTVSEGAVVGALETSA